MTTPLLSIRNIVAGYAGRDVLRGVSLEVTENAFISIIGPNGHGKSTLLRCISGLIDTVSGNIAFGGQDITHLDAPTITARGLVHIPQGDLLFPDMTVIENLRMGAYLTRGKETVRERLEEVLEILPKIADRRHHLARTLSGGERRMTAIGRGLMGGGRLTLFDEPSLGLAPLVIDQIYQIISRLHEGGRTVLVVEENAMRVVDQANRMYLLDNGQMTWEGTGRDFLANPDVVRAYLGG